MMTVEDVFLTPIYLVIFYFIAFSVRGKVTNQFTKPYFIPALSLKYFGAIALGFVYQFYYRGGDTFNYFHHSSLIYKAFTDSFDAGLKLMLTSGGDFDPKTLKYTNMMFWYQAGSSEYWLSRVAAFFGLLCFNSYVVIALFFASISFSGMWVMFITFVKIRPLLYKQLAIAVFFVPSVFFWGSGLMKDSLCLGALGWIFYCFYKGAIQRRMIMQCIIIGLIASTVLVKTKIYILLCFLPPALLWVFNESSTQIKNSVVRFVAKPFLIAIGLGLAYFAGTNLTKGDEEYDVDKIGKRTKIVSEYIYGVSVQQNGSAYTLGEQDGTLGGMLKLAPQAIVVALFRPFLWEVKNPVMLLSSLESLWFLFFTLRILFRSGVMNTLRLVAATPALTLCFLFALAFAGTVGVVSNNFGTLVRYKIPMIPFFVAGLYITESLSTKKKRNATASSGQTGRLVPA